MLTCFELTFSRLPFGNVNFSRSGVFQMHFMRHRFFLRGCHHLLRELAVRVVMEVAERYHATYRLTSRSDFVLEKKPVLAEQIARSVEQLG